MSLECAGECELDILSAFPDHTKQPLNSWGVAFGCLGARDWNRKREASHSHEQSSPNTVIWQWIRERGLYEYRLVSESQSIPSGKRRIRIVR